MIDKRFVEKTQIYKDFNPEENEYFFDMKQKRFLHNIDTFYYSVKFNNDFTAGSDDTGVFRLRKWVEHLQGEFEGCGDYASGVPAFIEGWDSTLNYRHANFAGYYNCSLSCPDYFDIFIAPKVPPGSDGGESLTCEVLVQIRSYMLWMYGVKYCYEESYKYIEILAKKFNLAVKFTQENRIDYCWHSNFLKNPEKFFNVEDFYKMRVDRFKDALFHTSKKGSEDYEIDYIAMGKRSDKVFIRIYLKSKEVVEKGYKPWFFKVWLFNGLINRYDCYVYEYAFVNHKWKDIDMGRIKFYSEFGKNQYFVDKCRDIVEGTEELTPDELKKLADDLTPAVNLVVNVEYQTMRKHTKTYELLPFFDNSDKLTAKRIYDYLDNRALICDYLTKHTFKMVEKYNGTNDSNKSRRDFCPFWKGLRSCKLTEYYIPEDSREMVRDYTRKLNSEIVKARAVKAAITYGIYAKGKNADEPLRDCFDALCVLNDNDLVDAYKYKQKKLRQFNDGELTEVQNNLITRSSNYSLINNNTGEIFD